MSKNLTAGIASLLLLLLFGFLPAGFCSSDSEQLYHQSWQLVRDHFYDKSFNGEDWSSWEHKFDGKLNSHSDAENAIRQMLGQLGDQYTTYLDQDSFKDEQNLRESNLVGIGIYLAPGKEKNSAPVVADVIEGGPANIAGIQKYEQLLEVDGQSVVQLTPEQIGKKLAGVENSSVRLKLAHKGSAHEVTVLRKQLDLRPVSAKNLPGNIGYLKLSSFIADDAAPEFRKALIGMANKDGLILDLRQNGGGLMVNALLIAEMFLEKGVIVRCVDREGSVSDKAQGNMLSSQPLVVLVNENSASASEILTAALKDHGRATIVGNRTFGKGLVQQVYPLTDGGALHLTIAQFMGPAGSKINKVGVQPDVLVPQEADQLKAALNILKNKISNSAAAKSPNS